jgi:topoisomerase-4 subunit A
MKGHGLDHKDFKYKDGDKEGFVVETQTTDKLSLFATNGRFYTIGCDKLPPGRGFGEPVRLMIDLPNDADILTVRIYNPDEKFLVASDDGRGFVVEGKEILAQTKNCKQVLNLDEGSEARVCVAIPANADHLAVIGSNRKMLVFPLAEVPVMGKGKGVILQKFKDGSLSDAKAFNLKFGLTYMSRGSETPVKDIKLWIGERAQAGRLPPNGFPSKAKF